MKMTKLTKLTALLLAILMVALAGTAYAVDTNQEGTGTSGTAITEVELTKDIVLFNTTSEDIYEPNITYTYTLAVQNPDSATITDKNGVTGTVKTGVAGLVTIQGSNGSGYTGTAGTSASLVFGDDSSAGSATNAEGSTVSSASKTASRNLKLAFNPSATGLTEAGIYRYVITDTTAAANLTAAGIVRSSDYDPVRYLDVYVEWADTTHTTLQVYGWVLYKTTDGTATADGESSLAYKDTASTTIKVTGYNVESEMLGSNSTADEYHTYNLSVTKTTTGTLADLGHEFPIAVTFANSTVTSLTDFYSTGDFANTELALSATGGYSVNTSLNSTPSVKDGDTFSFIGLPAGTTFLINEKNDTSDSYKVEIKDETTSTDLFAEAIVAAGENTALTTATALENDNGTAFGTEDIQITNTLDAISPTGLVLRFAPYALMLIGGVVLLVIAMKHRKSREEE